MPDRSGKRKPRTPRGLAPRLGCYLIVTDTKKTEKNYLLGLRDTIPKELQRQLTIHVEKAPTEKLVEKALAAADLHSQYGEIWIVFDRDRVTNFDQIICEAEAHGIHVAWSNPCIEVWFSAYWGKMLTAPESTDCCSQFSAAYERKVGQEYEKAEESIYAKLCASGSEADAILRAEQKLQAHHKVGRTTPSEMIPCTTLHRLVQEIRRKIPA